MLRIIKFWFISFWLSTLGQSISTRLRAQCKSITFLPYFSNTALATQVSITVSSAALGGKLHPLARPQESVNLNLERASP